MAEKKRKSVVTIDPDRLDLETHEHPDLVLNACEDSADLKHEVTIQQAALKKLRAELWLDVRENYKDYGFTDKPPTEKDTDAAIEISPPT